MGLFTCSWGVNSTDKRALRDEMMKKQWHRNPPLHFTAVERGAVRIISEYCEIEKQPQDLLTSVVRAMPSGM